ncbi:MAG: phosphoribosyltransferase family protein, partial [Acidobacteria bacterium]|nr:phosphoribosyltransferase family protein [Acidobacteriota bacterium]
ARWLRRGYNQAGLIARQMAIELGQPYSISLRRRLWTKPQTGLDRVERRANLRRAFSWRGPRVTGRPHWLLVDDIFTTGATLDRAARALKAAGVGRVTALIAAATPHPGAARPRIPGRNMPSDPPGWL